LLADIIFVGWGFPERGLCVGSLFVTFHLGISLVVREKTWFDRVIKQVSLHCKEVLLAL
jgi:hypothetical protein